jgi:hypothetical protein
MGCTAILRQLVQASLQSQEHLSAELLNGPFLDGFVQIVNTFIADVPRCKQQQTNWLMPPEWIVRRV